MLFKFIKHALVVVMLCGMTSIAFADDAAPVYDADNLPPQFDGQPDMGAAPAPSQANTAPVPPQPVIQPAQPVVQQQAAEQTFAPSPPEPLTVDQRMQRVEQQVANMQHSSSSEKMESLQNEVQSLRGQIDVLNHQLQQLENQAQQMQTQQRVMYTDLDKRVSKEPIAKPQKVATVKSTPATPTAAPKVKTVTKAPAPAAVTSNNSQPAIAEEQQTYQTAYDLIKARKYDDAIATLQKMLQKYPTGQFAANAHYWLGELYNLTGKNDQSAAEFATVVKDFPDSPKVADAQLKLGLIQASQFKWIDAKFAFKKVMSNYPGTASARLASEQLKQIKQAGH